MIDSVPVRKTGYRPKKEKGKKDPGVRVRRTALDFLNRDTSTDGIHEIGQEVKIHVAVYASGTRNGIEGEFAQALPGEWGVYDGDGLRFANGAGVVMCRIKLRYVTAYLIDDGISFEWA